MGKGASSQVAQAAPVVQPAIAKTISADAENVAQLQVSGSRAMDLSGIAATYSMADRRMRLAQGQGQGNATLGGK